MNRFEYLGALNNCIQHELPADEYNNVMQYYSEYFADAGIEKEQEVIQELGAPSELARRIIAEYRGRQPGEVKLNAKKKFPVGWIIFIAVAGSPIWLALLCVAIGVAAAVAAAVPQPLAGTCGRAALSGAKFTPKWFQVGTGRRFMFIFILCSSPLSRCCPSSQDG